jgi:Flp pilus assembly protein TadD
VEITASPISELPLEKNPRRPNAIVMHDDYSPEPLLHLAGGEAHRSLESDRVAAALLLDCAGSASGAAAVTTDVVLAVPRAEVMGGAPGPLARCVEQDLIARADMPTLRVTLRVTARFLLADETIAAVEEEIAALNDLPEDASARDPARTRARLSLLGSRHRDAAALSAARKGEHLAGARAAFEQLLALAGDDPRMRATALDGIASVLVLSGKPEDAVAPARAMVCPARFSFPSAAGALDQDHPVAYWKAWESMHPTAIGKTTPVKAPPHIAGGPRMWDEETQYRSPYEACAPLDAAPGVVADAWRRIGLFHATMDANAGPFRLNRAATALRRSLASASGPVRSFVALDLARVYLRQQRFGEAARVLLPLLASANVEDPELTVRAAQLLATSLTYLDLEGPPESAPSTGDWPDPADAIVNPAFVAEKMRVVAQRIETAELAPRDPTTLPLVLRWLSWELFVAGHLDEAARIAHTFLERFPNHRDAPVVERLERAAKLAQR